MAHGESNDHVIDDVTWPRKVGECYLATIAIITIVCCDCSAVGYPSDSLASCWALRTVL